MKKYILSLLFALISILSIAKGPTEWIEIQSVVIPNNTPIYYKYSTTGKIQYFLQLTKIGSVSISKTNAEKFLSGEIQLELVKWQSRLDSHKYKYTIRQYKPQESDVDLNDLFGFNSSDKFLYFDPETI